MNAFNIIKRNPNFFLVWVGQILSQSGARIYQMAFLWWILSYTNQNSGTWVGVFMVMTALPSIFLMKKIGLVIDTKTSKSILVRADLTTAILISFVSFLFHYSYMNIPIALFIGLFGATLQAFIDPTLNKALAEVVSKEDFDAGLSLLSTTQSLANFAGAVLGALLIERLGFSGTALLSAIGYFISSFASNLAHYSQIEKKHEEGQTAGWAVLDGHPLLKRLLIGFGFVNFFMTPTLVVLPVYVKKVLNENATTLGTLEAGLWLGLLLGALFSKFILKSWNKIKAGVLCISIVGICFGIPGFVVNSHVYLIVLCIAGIALGTNNVKFMSLFQETVAPEIKGRFFALMQGIIGFTFPIAYFLFGTLTDSIDVKKVCIIQGTGIILVAFSFLPLVTTDRRIV